MSATFQRPSYAQKDKANWFTGLRCASFVARLAKAPKSATNLYDESEMKSVCDEAGKEMTLVPGLYLSAKTDSSSWFRDDSEDIQISIRPDFTVVGYSRVGKTFGGLQSEIRVIEGHRKLVEVRSERSDQLTVTDLGGRFEFTTERMLSRRFAAGTSEKTLTYHKMRNGRTLTIHETTTEESVTLFGSSVARKVHCEARLENADGSTYVSKGQNEACFTDFGFIN